MIQTSTHQLPLPDASTVALTLTEQGAGPPVLLLHGGAGPQSMTELADQLATAATVHVLTPVHPGFDGTARPPALHSVAVLAALYVRLLDKLDLTDVTVIGNSLGGWVAAEMALAGSARVARMVLLDATGVEVPGHPAADLSSKTLPEILPLAFHDPLPFTADPTMLPAAAQQAASGNREALRAYSGPTGTDPGLLDRLPHAKLATTVLWGDSDRIVTPDYGRAMAAALPSASFTALPDSGHTPQVETPGQVVTEIVRFLRANAAWEHDYTRNTTAPPSSVWAALRDLYSGIKLSDAGDDITLHGPFSVGTRLSVTPHGTDLVIDCLITKLDQGKTFAYRSRFDGLYLTSRHTLTPLPAGGTRIVHHSQIAGPAAQTAAAHLGPRITADRAESMDDLVAAATTRARA